MQKEIFSNHIGGSSELTLLVDIKPGYVPCRGLITYADRLRRHLRLLSALRRVGMEGRRAGVYTGPIDALQTLQYVRWTLVDDDSRMLLAVNFDRPFEPYIRRIVDIAGPLLDTILCHCEGFLGQESDRGFDRFYAFARRFQVPVELFAAASPNLTADDGQYFQQVDSVIRKEDRPTPINVPAKDLIDVAVEPVQEKLARRADNDPLPALDQALNILQSLYDNAHLFPNTDFRGDLSRDDVLYYRLAERLTPGFWPRVHRRLLDATDPTAPHHSEPDAEQVTEINEFIEHLINTIGTQADDNLKLLDRHRDARNWYAKPPKPPVLTDPGSKAHGTIQPGLLRDPDSTASPRNASCQMLLRIDDATGGRAFLNNMADLIWPGDGETEINLSITHAGLKALDINERLLRQFPSAFREGMSARAGLLGDTDVNNPSEWEWPRTNWNVVNSKLQEAGAAVELTEDSVDIIIQVAGYFEGATPEDLATFSDTHPLFAKVEEVAALAATHQVALTVVDALYRKLEPVIDGKTFVTGHLGFADGISQPRYERDGTNPAEYDVVNAERGGVQEKERSPLGDLLIGHKAKTDLVFALRPSDDGLQTRPFPEYHGSPLQDGTFQVIRKIALDKSAFDAVDAQVETDGASPPDLADIQAAMVGRDAKGKPLGGGAAGEQNFNYSKNSSTSHADEIPLQSHIRRANPREADTPRILRRGFSFGAPGGDDVGMMFIAYNANIAEQFEVIQRWISGGNSTGLNSDQGDPLLAPRRVEKERTFRFKHGTDVVQVSLPKVPLAQLRWGIYAFTPSETGLRSLAQGGTPHEALAPTLVPAPVQRLTQLDTEASFQSWKLLLESIDDERRADKDSVWESIRDKGGAVRTSYGVLVGGPDQVRQVLENQDNAFSVRTYWARMKESIGVQHLSYDDPPVQTEESDPDAITFDAAYRRAVNPGDHATKRAEVDAFLGVLASKPADLFNQAKQIAEDAIDIIPTDTAFLPTAPTTDVTGKRILAEPFFYDVIAQVCIDVFGLPNIPEIDFGGPQGDKPHCPIDLANGSFYVFWPHPTDHHVHLGRTRTKALVDAIKAHLTSGWTPPPDTLMAHMLGLGTASPARAVEIVCGAAFGLAGPTSGSLRGTFFDWIDTGFLWRAKQRIVELGNYNYTHADAVMSSAIVTSMSKRAAPDLLHRVAVRATRLGNVDVQPGERIVMSLGSAARAAPGAAKDFLFGYTQSGKAIHACQGREMALQIIAGVMSAIMEAGEVKPESPQSVRIIP